VDWIDLSQVWGRGELMIYSGAMKCGGNVGCPRITVHCGCGEAVRELVSNSDVALTFHT
jgi:hypothetical protein